VVSRPRVERTRQLLASWLKETMLPSSPYGKTTSSRHSALALSRTRTTVEESAGFIETASRTSKDSSSVPHPRMSPGF
jgi:hypothetical protein